MKNQMLHVFRNTPFGRQTFLQSIYFSKIAGFHLKVFIPKYHQFLMYFSKEVVTVDLDKAFLWSPNTARPHAENLIARYEADADFLTPKDYTASVLADIPVDLSLMCCPRSISDLSSKISLGYIGPKVRAIIKNAAFPVLIPSPVFQKWKSIVVFFGGSTNAAQAFRLGMRLQEKSGLPVKVFTYGENKPRSHYQTVMEEKGLYSHIESGEAEWIFRDDVPLKEALYDVPEDGLVVVGAYGHGLIKEVVFGSMMEEIQTILPNNMLIVGPCYEESWT